MSEEILEIDYLEAIEYSLDPLILHTDYRIMYINQAAENFFGARKDEVIGSNPLSIFEDSSKTAITKRIQSAYEDPAELIEETVFKMDGTTVEVELYCHPIQVGDKKAIQTYVRDITERKKAEQEQKEMRAQVNELSAPLVPLGNELAILPLVGQFDDQRATQLLESVPEKVRSQNINFVIMDFSGIYGIDNVVANYLFKLNNILSMLGVQSIITGLRPELAIVANNLNIDLSAIPTMNTVKDALSSLGIKV